MDFVRYDIADYVTSDWSKGAPTALLDLLTHDPLHPQQILSTPIGAVQREWLKRFEFLEYSVRYRSVFCRYCSLGFAIGQHGVRNVKGLVRTPFDVNQGAGKLETHSNAAYHKHAEQLARKYLKKQESPIPLDVSTLVVSAPDLDQSSIEKESLTVSAVTSLMKCVELLARQGSALRGHNEVCWSTLPPIPVMYGSTCWNFSNFDTQILSRIDAGDELLKRHLCEAPPRQKYTSYRSQNAMISLMAEKVQNTIVKEVFSRVTIC